MRKQIVGALLAAMAAIWSPGPVGAETARQIAAELFDFPVEELGQPSVLGAKLGCDLGLIDTWDGLRMVLLLAAFDPNQLQAAFDQMNGDASSLALCVGAVHKMACNPNAIDFVAPSVAGAVIGGVLGPVAERVVGGGIGAMMNPAIMGGLGAGGAVLHLGICNKRKVGAMEALRAASLGDHAQHVGEVTLSNVLLTYRDAKQRLDPAAWAIVAEYTRSLEESAINSVRRVR